MKLVFSDFFSNVFLFLLIFVLKINFCFSQSYNMDSLETLYNKSAIWFNYPFYYKDGNRIHYSELRNEFSFSPKARLEYELGIKKIKSGRIFSYAAIAVSTASIFVIGKNKNYGLGMFAGALIINGIGINISLDGRKRIQQAIFIRNKDLLFSPK